LDERQLATGFTITAQLDNLVQKHSRSQLNHFIDSEPVLMMLQ